MTWAHYLLQVNIYLVIFYTFYKLLLDKETYFMLNRLYLIMAGMLSLAIPFIKPEWFLGAEAPQKFRISVDQLNMMMANVTIAPDQIEQFNWAQLVTAIYVSGILFFVVRLVYRLIAVKRLMNSRREGMAFSFFRKKVIDENLPELDTINIHEDIHIRQLHTMDILFFELLGILVWCNPVIYLYKITVKNIHEYLADEEAALFQGDKESYAMLLLSKAFGIDQNILTNSFVNQSLLKKRIFMLHKQRSKKRAILKYGLFLPLFAGLLLLSSATISRNKEIKAVAETISAPISMESIPAMVKLAQKGEISISKAERKSDSWTPFYTYLSRSIRYPVKAQNSKLQGNTVIKFSIHNGEVSGLGVVSALGMGCDATVMKNILDYDNFGDIKDGDYSIKVAFRLSDVNTPITNAGAIYPRGYTTLREVTVKSVYERFPAPGKKVENVAVSIQPSRTENKVYDFVSIETQPGFPGGMDKFYSYLSKAVKYPVEAQRNNVQGKVFLSFIVETDGQLTNIKVERSLGSGTDEEAVRVMKASPKWTPAMNNGEPVRVKYNMPMNFSLSDESSKVLITEQIPNGSTTTSGSGNIAFKPNPVSKASTLDPAKALWVVDGVKSDKGGQNLDPSTIKSMTILKDASATTIYGDDGKDGVIEIITKKGKIKSPPPAPTAPATITITPKN